jgi:hypothetical protein
MVCLDANAEIAKGRLVQISALRGQPLLDVLHGLDRAARYCAELIASGAPR